MHTRSHGSSVTTFSFYANVHKQVYGGITKDEKERSQ